MRAAAAAAPGFSCRLGLMQPTRAAGPLGETHDGWGRHRPLRTPSEHHLCGEQVPEAIGTKAWTCCTICALVQEARLVDQINATVVSCAPKSGVALVRHVGDSEAARAEGRSPGNSGTPPSASVSVGPAKWLRRGSSKAERGSSPGPWL